MVLYGCYLIGAWSPVLAQNHVRQMYMRTDMIRALSPDTSQGVEL